MSGFFPLCGSGVRHEMVCGCWHYGIIWVSASESGETQTRRMGLLGRVSAGRPTKTRQIQADTHTNTHANICILTHTHTDRVKRCQLSDVLSSHYKPPVFLSSACKHSKILSFYPPIFLSLTHSCTAKKM